MDEKSRKRCFGMIGDSIDRTFQEASEDIRSGSKTIAEGVFDVFESLLGNDEPVNSDEDPNLVLVNQLLQRINQIAEPVGPDFSYSTILRWVKKNAIGNRFYLLKHTPADSNISYIFVFFGNNKDIMLDDSDPVVCFICKKIPESIQSLFGEKQIFIQPFE